MTAWRTSRNSCVGRIRAKTWTPRLPEVLAQPVRPSSASSSRRAWAASHRVGEVGAGLRVEVDPQLVRAVVVVAAHRPGVEGDGVHLHRPHRRGDLVDDQLGVAAAGGVGHGTDRAQAGRRAAGSWRRTPRPSTPSGEALQRHRAVAQGAQEPVGHRHGVVGQVQLGEAVIRPHHPVRARDPHVADHAVRPGHLHHRRTTHAPEPSGPPTRQHLAWICPAFFSLSPVLPRVADERPPAAVHLP